MDLRTMADVDKLLLDRAHIREEYFGTDPVKMGKWACLRGVIAPLFVDVANNNRKNVDITDLKLYNLGECTDNPFTVEDLVTAVNHLRMTDEDPTEFDAVWKERWDNMCESLRILSQDPSAWGVCGIAVGSALASMITSSSSRHLCSWQTARLIQLRGSVSVIPITVEELVAYARHAPPLLFLLMLEVAPTFDDRDLWIISETVVGRDNELVKDEDSDARVLSFRDDIWSVRPRFQHAFRALQTECEKLIRVRKFMKKFNQD